MKLIKPSKKYEQSWQEALAEFRKEKAEGFWNMDGEPTNLDEYIKKTKDHEEGKNLHEGWVPATTYWLIDKEEFIGHTNIRHKLTEELKTEGGNIGYYIRPTARKKGYGTKMLELALHEAEKIGLKKVLITCEESNIGSRKVIERNGGKYRDKVTKNGKTLLRFWVEL